MPVRTRLVALLLFGSGFCALIYQTAWLREFRLVFGASTAASAAVLGVFMAGLGFGGIFLGRRSETKGRPLAFYAKLELFIALSAALSPLLILAARHLYIALGGTLAMGMTLGTIVRLILAVVILGTPTFLMGGTLPAAVRAVIAPDDVSRRAVGVLYGVNTLGAVTGTLLGTFYLFENFGNHLTLWWAVAVNAVVALSAFHFSKSMPEMESRREFVDEDSRATAQPLFVFIAAGLVGFAFFLMEIVWYRMLGPLLGGSTFSFGLILAVALLGIGLGGVAYALFNLKRSASLHLFALTCAAEAFFMALPYALGDRIAVTAMLLRPLGTLGFHGHVIAWSALCFIVVFPPAFISGVQFPLLIALLGKGRRCVGSQTGSAYAWNTIGALIGSLAGGFGFIPLFSAPGVWKFVVVILSALAIVAAFIPSREPRQWIRATIPVSISVLALAMLMAIGPTAFWRHGQIGVGRLKNYHASPNDLRDLVYSIRRHIMWQTDGIESSVALNNADSVSFIVNGKSDGNAKTDAGTQLMCGLIGAALHPNPQKALVVGLGTGSTAGWLASVPSVQRVDVVELEPAILKVAEICAPVNRNALANPKLHVIIGDGRELLLTIRDKYDLIASEPSNPYRAGVAGLFTREFYQSVENRLKPGGIFLQWVQTYDVDDRTIEIFYRTLGSVFPNIESWQTQEGDLLLVASREPFSYHLELLRKRLAEEPFQSALLAAWRGNGPEDFLAHYVGNNTVTKIMQELEAWPLNTDDRTVIEFAFARSVSVPNGFQMASLRAAAAHAHCDRPEISDGEIDWGRVEEARFATTGPLDRAEQIQPGAIMEQRNRLAALANYMKGDLAGALRFWRAQAEEPKTLTQLTLLAECLAAAGDNVALKYIEQLAAFLPSDAEAIRSTLYWKQGKKSEATESLKNFFRLAREDPWPEQERIKRCMGLAETIAKSDWSKEATGSFYDVLRKPLCVWNGEAERAVRLLSIGMHMDGKNFGERTASALEAFEPNVMWERTFLEVRKSCYTNLHNPRARQASRDLDEFFSQEALTADLPTMKKEFEMRAREQSSK
jgi:spermidine synthase